MNKLILDLLRSRYIYIIACWFLATIGFNEITACVRFSGADTTLICDGCDTRNTGQNSEERSMEEEHKLLAEPLIIFCLYSRDVMKSDLYRLPYLAKVNLGIVTPPPRH